MNDLRAGPDAARQELDAQWRSIVLLEGDATNYDLWRETIRDWLDMSGLLKYADTDVPSPEDEDELCIWTGDRATCYDAIFRTTSQVHRILEIGGHDLDGDPRALYQAIGFARGGLYTPEALRKIGCLDRASYAGTRDLLEDFHSLRIYIAGRFDIDEGMLALWLLNSLKSTHKHLFRKNALGGPKPCLERVLRDLERVCSAEENEDD
ncbi:hypothetical protein IMZ48_10275 [Candidatus Bathyarchaeota archaeon]|nr:hypothetical protein [Candidatus Bathyarchaeota archaeon]